MRQIGVFGASFNPPTLGHQDVVNQALEHFDEILLVPSLSHPFQKKLAPIEHRLKMLTLFLTNWQRADQQNKIKIYNIEAEIQTEHPESTFIYTYDVLSEIEKAYQTLHEPFQIHFIMGPDNASPRVWHQFYRYQDIEKQWPLFIAKEQIPIHSTSVKENIAKYQNDPSLLKKVLMTMVGEPIAQYILQHHLYHKIQKESTYG
ncbi:MAG: adenylyltransferase/cytidyltransferase family protein [Candidatus Berkiellales bacterium]